VARGAGCWAPPKEGPDYGKILALLESPCRMNFKFSEGKENNGIKYPGMKNVLILLTKIIKYINLRIVTLGFFPKPLYQRWEFP
jgi:hypothetical protein